MYMYIYIDIYINWLITPTTPKTRLCFDSPAIKSNVNKQI